MALQTKRQYDKERQYKRHKRQRTVTNDINDKTNNTSSAYISRVRFEPNRSRSMREGTSLRTRPVSSQTVHAFKTYGHFKISNVYYSRTVRHRATGQDGGDSAGRVPSIPLDPIFFTPFSSEDGKNAVDFNGGYLVSLRSVWDAIGRDRHGKERAIERDRFRLKRFTRSKVTAILKLQTYIILERCDVERRDKMEVRVLVECRPSSLVPYFYLF